MPEKQPDVWAAITAQMYQYFLKHDTAICVALGVAFVTALKMLSDKKRDKFWGVVSHSLIAGFIVMGASDLLDNLGYDQDYIHAIGIILTLFGVDWFRAKLIKWAKKHGFLDEDD